MTTRKKVPWSHWDRFLFIVLGIVFVLVVGLSLWFHALDKNPEVIVPMPTPPANNAFNYFKSASDAVMDSEKIGTALDPQPSIPVSRLPKQSRFPRMGAPPMGGAMTTPSYTFAQKEALVNENLGAIQMLHLGFRYPFQEPPVRSFSTMLPQYQKMRGLARVLALQAQIEAVKGDWNGAMTSDMDAIQIGETMPRGGPLIGMLVGVACQAIGRRPAWQVVDHLNASQARTAAHRLEQIRSAHVLYAETLQEQKWVGQAGLLELMQRRDWPSDVGTYIVSDDFGQSDWQKQVAFQRIRLTGKRTIMANYMRYMNQLIADAKQPYATHPADPPTPSDLFNQLTFMDFSKVRVREVNANTENALLLVTLALRAYKLEHGAYPVTLSALAPQYLKAIPDDPFALSGPLHYKNIGSKYLLYSVGPDGKDDGGKPIFDRTKSAPTVPGAKDPRYWVQQDSQGDIVAGINITG